MTDTEISILNAAQAVFLRNGLAATSMGDIAREARLSRPSLHYYHRTKEALFRAILARAVGRLFPELSSIAKRREPLTVKLEQILDLYHRVLLDNPLLPQFILHEAQRDPQGLLKMVRGQRDVDALFAFLRRELAPKINAAIPPERALAQFFCIVYALLFAPFLAKPLLDILVFDHDPARFRSFVLDERKPLLMTALAALLAPRKQSRKRKQPRQKIRRLGKRR
jgi:AcrR family transcriptional regulator